MFSAFARSASEKKARTSNNSGAEDVAGGVFSGHGQHKAACNEVSKPPLLKTLVLAKEALQLLWSCASKCLKLLRKSPVSALVLKLQGSLASVGEVRLCKSQRPCARYLESAIFVLWMLYILSKQFCPSCVLHAVALQPFDEKHD